MTEVVHYLDVHTGAVQAAATTVLVLVTAWYTILTRNMAKSAREAQRPYVYVDIGGEGGAILEFVIGNDGDRAARDIRLQFSIAGECTELEQQLIELNPFRSGISHLAPRRRYRYELVVQDNSIFDQTRSPHVVLTIAVEYKGDRTHEERFVIDLTSLAGISLSSWAEPAESIARQLKELVGVQRSKGRRSGLTGRPIPTKSCPACASTIPQAAIRCRECLADLAETPP